METVPAEVPLVSSSLPLSNQSEEIAGCRRGAGRGQGARRGQGGKMPKGFQNVVGWETVNGFINSNGQKPSLETTGPKSNQTANNDQTVSTMLEFLLLFFTEEVIEEIVEQSNLFYSQSGDNIKNWKDISVPEMKAFLGIVLAMGIVNYPNFHDFWANSDPIICTPWFSDIMPRDRFFLILKYLHLSDKTKEPARDDRKYKLHEIGCRTTLIMKTF